MDAPPPGPDTGSVGPNGGGARAPRSLAAAAQSIARSLARSFVGAARLLLELAEAAALVGAAALLLLAAAFAPSLVELGTWGRLG
jgi:hypothetical protein